MSASRSTWLGASAVSSSHSRSAAASGVSPGSMCPAGNSHSTRLTLWRYCRISTMRPSSRTGISTTHGAWRMVTISCVRPLPSGAGTCSTSTANTRVVHTIAMDLFRQLVEHALQILGQRAHELHSPVVGGMSEHEPRGVEEGTGEMRDGAQIAGHTPMDAAVQRIADNRVPDRVQMNANLMGASRINRD